MANNTQTTNRCRRLASLLVIAVGFTFGVDTARAQCFTILQTTNACNKDPAGPPQACHAPCTCIVKWDQILYKTVCTNSATGLLVCTNASVTNMVGRTLQHRGTIFCWDTFTTAEPAAAVVCDTASGGGECPPPG